MWGGLSFSECVRTDNNIHKNSPLCSMAMCHGSTKSENQVQVNVTIRILAEMCRAVSL